MKDPWQTVLPLSYVLTEYEDLFLGLVTLRL